MKLLAASLETMAEESIFSSKSTLCTSVFRLRTQKVTFNLLLNIVLLHTKLFWHVYYGRQGACPPHLRLRLKQAALSSANRGQAVKQTSTHLTINAWWISKRPLLIEDKLVVAFTTNNINNVENNEQHQLSTANWASITSNAIAQWISWRPYIVWQSFYTSCWCPHYRRHHRGC